MDARNTKQVIYLDEAKAVLSINQYGEMRLMDLAKFRTTIYGNSRKS